jgi:LCP family protein required for cell wall assembly
MPNDFPHLGGRHRSVYRSTRRRLFARRRDVGSLASSHAGVRRSRHSTRRRWPKRVLAGIASLVILVVVLLAADAVYVYVKLGDIKRETVSTLVPAKAGQPLDVLLVGSDSRQCDSAAQAAAFGTATSVTGQRSDTLLVARFLADGQVELLSIPRDLWVPIWGTHASAKINSAFNNGPAPLVKTIETDLGIPINHVVLTNFCGFPAMVNALGGIYMDFRYPVTDRYTGLYVTHLGCQLVDGTEALQIVRSRHLYYYSDGHWHYDGMSDFSRIKRQQAFFHALLDRIHSVVPDVFRLNSFVDAAVHDIAVDSTFSPGEMLALAWRYHSLSVSNLHTSTLPVSEAIIDGQDALLPIPEDKTVVAAFLSGNVRSFAAALGGSPTPVLTSSSVVNPNALREPWNPQPCNP